MSSIKVILPVSTTVGDFFSKYSKVFDNFNEEDFLNFINEGSTKSNKELILSALGDKVLQNQSIIDIANKSYSTVVMEAGITVYLPSQKVTRRVSYRQLPVPKITDFSAFVSKNIDSIIRTKFRKGITKNIFGTTITSYGKPTCYVFSKVNNDWYNLSKMHVTSDMTKQSGGAGELNISFASIPSKYDFDSRLWLPELKYGENVFVNHLKSGHSQDFISTIVQENDLILFRFDDNKVDSDNVGDFVGDKRLDSEFSGLSTVFNSDQSYDFIGLVDSVEKDTNYVEGNTKVRVSCRDLTKVLIEDGMYFFLNQFFKSITNKDLDDTAQTVDGKEAYIRFIQDEMGVVNFKTDKSISLLIEYIYKLYSRSAWIPDEAFEKTKLENPSTEYDFDNFDVLLTDKPRKGVWKIIRSVYDPSVANRRYVGIDLSQESGSPINFINSICADPFVEFFGDTYGNRFVFQVRKPPFDKKSLLSYLDDNYENEELAIAKTSGNKTYDLQVESTKLNEIFSIEDYEIVSENLRYSDEAYSWYCCEPRNFMFGNNQSYAAYLAPSLYFEAYGRYFGNKPYHRVMPYDYPTIDEDSNFNDRKQKLTDYLINDLQYLIETTAYLPFTRMGTITIQGNRNLKQGYHVYNVKTDEVFYIEGVSHRRDSTTSNSFFTTLTLSRGMVRKYIKGVKNNGINYSYFNLINTEIPESLPDEKRSSYISNWRVNEQVFSFFLDRRVLDTRPVLSLQPRQIQDFSKVFKASLNL